MPSSPARKRALKKKQAPRPRLRRTDWIEAGLDLLIAGRAGQLKIEGLTGELEVTKGSFYHHFENWDDFVDQLLKYWVEELTAAIRNGIEHGGGSAEERLLAVALAVVETGAARCDLAMHAWALRDQRVAKAVSKAESIRLRYLRSLFAEIGFEGEELEMRTRTFVVFYSFDLGLRSNLSKAKRLEHAKRRHEMLVKRP